MSYYDSEIGNLDEFLKQSRICSKLNLENFIIGPVYKAWRPQTNVNRNILNSEYLTPVSTCNILLEVIKFVKKYKRVTVRQIYYGLVSHQIINNNKNEYNRIVRILKNARLAGLVDFDRVIDDTREAQKTPSWNNMKEILEAAIKQYRSNWWSDQSYYVEVWLEKRALRRIFLPITDYFDVHLCVGGGYQSWSEIWDAKKRFESMEDKDIIILYFGDLDPSGKDMPRDIRERFQILGIDVRVEEVALTRDDIERYNLPRNPTKPGDTRKRWYIEKYGITYGVELDALPPNILKRKIIDAILEYCDSDLLEEKRELDEEEKERWREVISEHSS